PYLFNAMASQASGDSFLQNQVSIVTFNYDRSLEQFLYRAIRARFAVDERMALEFYRKISIVHVHGKLSPLEVVADGGRPYSKETTPDIIKEAAAQIKIIHEGGMDVFGRALHYLRGARQVFFLGFSFHHKNLERLQINTWNRPKVYCCR